MVDRNKTKNIQLKGDEKGMRRNENGITLIALIITIIILVILAAVSIRAVYNMGIVGHAINGTQQYAEGAKAENEMLGQTVTKLEDAVAKVKEIQGRKDGSSSATIQIEATEMTEEEINAKGITRQEDNSAIIKVTQKPTTAQSKEQLQALEESNPEKVQNMYITALIIVGSLSNDATWDEEAEYLKENVGIENPKISDSFSDWFPGEVAEVNGVQCDNVYDFIIQAGGYIEPLKYICNINNVDVEKTGTEVYFEITEDGTYNIVAKDENNNVVGTTTCTVKLIAKLILFDGTVKSLENYHGKTWYEFATDPNNTESYPIAELNKDLKDIIKEWSESGNDALNWIGAGRQWWVSRHYLGGDELKSSSIIEHGQTYYITAEYL